MLNEQRLLCDIATIHAAAHAWNDGHRCAVAPHPDLRDKINEAVRDARAAGGLPRMLSLHAVEPNVYGFNDGTIYPPEHPQRLVSKRTPSARP